MTSLARGLAPLGFLIGRFRGEGDFSLGPGGFVKESLGAPEVGGCYLSLRMAATYHMPDGRADHHGAFVLVGLDPPSGALRARVFDDAGRMREHEVEIEGGGIRFVDRVPHEISADRARKRLLPRDDGYEETLEIDRGGGRGFEVYSTVTMRRLS